MNYGCFYSILKLEDIRFGEVKYLPQDHTVNISNTDLNPILFFSSLIAHFTQWSLQDQHRRKKFNRNT